MATIKVKTDLNSRNYKRGIKDMQRQNKSFGKGLKSVQTKMKGAFKIAAIILLIRTLGRLAASLVNAGSKLSDLSAQTGVAVDDLNKLNDAALNAGSSADKMAKALVSLKDAQGEVLDGDQLMTDAFNNLGISIDDVATSDTVELFERISKAVTDSGNSSKELSASFDILGKRNAMELIEAMNEVAGGLDNVQQAGKALSDSSAQQLDVIADMWERKKKSITASAAGILANIFGASGKVSEEVERRQARAETMKGIEAESRLADLAELKAKAEEERLKKVKKIRDEEIKIAEQRAKDIKKIKESVTIGIDTNAIRRIGGFAGSKVNDSLRYARQSAERLAKIEDYNSSLPKIEKNTEKKGASSVPPIEVNIANQGLI
ncbi:MAG: hypothetical protein GY833_23945 [Aestuariibacter sp.]|nr:hypothetical protein [Aestuariibacter sp.]